MEKNHRTIEEVVSKVDTEELGYAILWYYGRELNSENKQLNQLWARAFDALYAVNSCLEATGLIEGT